MNVRVLMIDDSKAICMAVRSKLADENGTAFDSVNDPRDALQRVIEFEPTIILLDLEMPEMSGFEVLELLRSDSRIKTVPIIMLSGTADPEKKARAFLLGANDYAEKHMAAVELNSRIEYHSQAFVNAQRLRESNVELRETKKQLERQRDFIRSTFGRYLSNEIVDQLLESPEGLELGGEQRVVSIMMADLRGFTSMSERLKPSNVLAIVNNFLKVMTEVLIEHQGTIDEFIGDAILAIFGAPVFRSNDAFRAVQCALEMQLSMERVNAWNRSRGFPEIEMGIGINTGEVVVGNIGSEKRSKYGIVGSNVNLTSRIESYTEGGQILVSQATVEACGPGLCIEGELEVAPKGVQEPLTLYWVGSLA